MNEGAYDLVMLIILTGVSILFFLYLVSVSVTKRAVIEKTLTVLSRQLGLTSNASKKVSSNIYRFETGNGIVLVLFDNARTDSKSTITNFIDTCNNIHARGVLVRVTPVPSDVYKIASPALQVISGHKLQRLINHN